MATSLRARLIRIETMVGNVERALPRDATGAREHVASVRRQLGELLRDPSYVPDLPAVERGPR